MSVAGLLSELHNYKTAQLNSPTNNQEAGIITDLFIMSITQYPHKLPALRFSTIKIRVIILCLPEQTLHVVTLTVFSYVDFKYRAGMGGRLRP
ncbi:MAG: hypothetical protein LBH59_10325 [Planctomycetaceae bacterium]|nr:hypothetical protein [Planctomycetaceae bacterium]